jgi:hypothetical protein
VAFDADDTEVRRVNKVISMQDSQWPAVLWTPSPVAQVRRQKVTVEKFPKWNVQVQVTPVISSLIKGKTFSKLPLLIIRRIADYE